MLPNPFGTDEGDEGEEGEGGGIGGYSYQTIAIFLFVLIAVFVCMRNDVGGIRTKFLMTIAPDKDGKKPAKGTLYNLLYKLGMNPEGKPKEAMKKADVDSAKIEELSLKNKNKAAKIQAAMDRADAFVLKHGGGNKQPTCSHYTASSSSGGGRGNYGESASSSFQFSAKGETPSALLCDMVRMELETNAQGEVWKPAFMSWANDHGARG